MRMLDFRLLLANAVRWKVLAGITVLTVAVAFFLFGLLLSLDRVFNSGIKIGDADRLVVANATSLMQSLPLSYEDQIRAHEDVTAINRNVFFGGFYREPKNGLMAIATEPAGFLEVVPELEFASDAERTRWLDDPATIAVGRSLAERHDWKVGDLVPIFSFMYPRKDGGYNWVFRVAAVYDTSAKGGNTNSLLIHYSYFDEQRAHSRRSVGWYGIRIRDARQAQRVSTEIDQMFLNSPYETHTATEAQFAQELISQVGDFSAIVRVAIVAVFFTMILVAANSMIHSVNERVGEIATLKALGATDSSMALAVLVEATLIMAVGAVIGTAMHYLVVPHIASYSATLSRISFHWTDQWWVVLAVVALGMVTAVAPALQAWKVDTAGDLGRAA